jgi:hypothetical protein
MIQGGDFIQQNGKSGQFDLRPTSLTRDKNERKRKSQTIQMLIHQYPAGESIYGGEFDDENFDLDCDREGQVLDWWITRSTPNHPS